MLAAAALWLLCLLHMPLATDKDGKLLVQEGNKLSECCCGFDLKIEYGSSIVYGEICGQLPYGCCGHGVPDPPCSSTAIHNECAVPPDFHDEDGADCFARFKSDVYDCNNCPGTTPQTYTRTFTPTWDVTFDQPGGAGPGVVAFRSCHLDESGDLTLWLGNFGNCTNTRSDEDVPGDVISDVEGHLQAFHDPETWSGFDHAYRYTFFYFLEGFYDIGKIRYRFDRLKVDETNRVVLDGDGHRQYSKFENAIALEWDEVTRQWPERDIALELPPDQLGYGPWVMTDLRPVFPTGLSVVDIVHRTETLPAGEKFSDVHVIDVPSLHQIVTVENVTADGVPVGNIRPSL